MSSTVFQLNPLPANETQGISAALAEVGLAFKHLAAALLHTVAAPAAPKSRARSAQEEAQELRNFAFEIQARDPEFAQDLFAAADRHEIESRAR